MVVSEEEEVTVRRERRGDGVCRSGSYTIPDDSLSSPPVKTSQIQEKVSGNVAHSNISRETLTWHGW